MRRHHLRARARPAWLPARIPKPAGSQHIDRSAAWRGRVLRIGGVCLAVLILIVISTIPAAKPARADAPAVGNVRHVTVWATRTPPAGDSEPLYPGTSVFQDDLLATIEDGGCIVRFVDGTELRVAAESAVMLDETLLADIGGGAALRLSMTDGIARFITGDVGAGLVVTTPTAQVGVRGTDFSVWVEDEQDGLTTVWVNAGTVIVTPTAGGPTAEVARGETVRVVPGAERVERNAARPPSTPELLPTTRPGTSRRDRN